jgi:hypothetical protein
MLTVRSKISVTVAAVAGLTALAGLLDNRVSWAKEPLADSYVLWILVGLFVSLAVLSVLLDVRKNNS